MTDEIECVQPFCELRSFDRRDFFRFAGVAGAGLAALASGDTVLAQEVKTALYSIYLPYIENERLEGSVELNAALALTKFTADYKIPVSVVDYSTWANEANGIEITTYLNRAIDITTLLIKNAGFDPAAWDKIERKITRFIFEVVTTGFASTQEEDNGATIRLKLNKLVLAEFPLAIPYLLGNELQHIFFRRIENSPENEWLSNMHALSVASGFSKAEFDEALGQATTPPLLLNGSSDLLYVTANTNKIIHPADKSIYTYIAIIESQAAILTGKTLIAAKNLDLTSVYKYINGESVVSMATAIQQMQTEQLFTKDKISLTPDYHAQVVFRENIKNTHYLWGYTVKTSTEAQSLSPSAFAGNNDSENMKAALSYTDKNGTRQIAILSYSSVYDNDTRTGGIRIELPDDFTGSDNQTYPTIASGNVWYLLVRPEPDPNINTRAYSFLIGDAQQSVEQSIAELEKVRQLVDMHKIS